MIRLDRRPALLLTSRTQGRRHIMFDCQAALAVGEGRIVQSLPLIPISTPVAVVPLEPPLGTRKGEPQLVQRVCEVLEAYNHNVKLLGNSYDENTLQASAAVVEQAQRINAVVRNATKMVAALTGELVRRADRFDQCVPLRDDSLWNGSWTGRFDPDCSSLPPTADEQVFGEAELRRKLAAYRISDPHAFVSAVYNSLQNLDDLMLDRLNENVISKPPIIAKAVRIFVDKLMSLEGGRPFAFELAFSVKLANCTKTISELSVSKLEHQALDVTILRLFHETWHPVEDSGAHRPPGMDPAAAVRRLRASMVTHGCHDGKQSILSPAQDCCWCHRQLSFKLLRDLQIMAYSTIRAKVFLTAGSVVPAELIEPIFELAMAAEEMPLDPQVAVDAGQWSQSIELGLGCMRAEPY